ncbi:MAG: 5-formyltetrahydrofolate cyclo-ligase [Symbiobacteriaceae bacterium]|jgi:5-formyltetrahydrofolate cyclo-ligase|nr:5-formyltetrahydrofolate cyclo-ligase [Symbiobacteriaceae bacterium]
MEKQQLRTEMLARRQSLAPDERERRSLAAQEALIGSPAFAAAHQILIYIAFRGEVGTERIAEAAVTAGKGLVLPRVVKEPRGLVLHAYSGNQAALARGAYGIMEPRPEWPVVTPAEVDLVVVPGVAFDRTGGRLGYGGGYYDRLLPMMGHARLAGLAYECQVVEGLPKDPHDIPVDGLATEMGYTDIRGDR